MRTYTIAQLKTLCMQRADMENSTFIDTATGGELENYINASIAELHDLLCTTYEDYFLTSRIIAINGNQDVYQLPEDFYKDWRVEVDRTSDFQQPIRLRRFMGPEWTRNSSSVVIGATGLLVARYRIMGSNIFLAPKPTSSGFMRIWYYPPAKKMKDLSTNTDKPNGYSYSFSDSAVNTSNDTITIVDHGYSVGDRISFSNVGGALPTPIPSGTDLCVIPVTKDTFRISDNFGTGFSQNVQNAFDNVYMNITAASGGGTHYINDDLNIYDGQNGWEEYVLCDVAAKLLEKEQNDSVAERTRKNEIEERIGATAKARDIGESQRVVDVYAHDFYPGFFYGKLS